MVLVSEVGCIYPLCRHNRVELWQYSLEPGLQKFAFFDCVEWLLLENYAQKSLPYVHFLSCDMGFCFWHMSSAGS